MNGAINMGCTLKCCVQTKDESVMAQLSQIVVATNNHATEKSISLQIIKQKVKSSENPYNHLEAEVNRKTSPTLIITQPPDHSLHELLKATQRELKQPKVRPPYNYSAPIVFESEIMKYRPGISHEYISRWCQLTDTQFRCFKNKRVAQCLFDEPLQIIFISDIEEVIPSQSQAGDFLFQFYLKEEDEDLIVTREVQQSTVSNSLVAMTSALSPQMSVEEGRLMKRPVRSDLPISSVSGEKISGKSSWTYRETEWFASEKRLLFGARTKEIRDEWVKAVNKLCK